MTCTIKYLVVMLSVIFAGKAMGENSSAARTSATTTQQKTVKASPLDTIKIKTVQLGNRLTMNMDSIELEPDYMSLPLIFEKYEAFDEGITAAEPENRQGAKILNVDDNWLKSAQSKSNLQRKTRYHAMINNPELTRYNLDILPDPPKQYAMTSDPSTIRMELEKRDLDQKLDIAEDETEIVKVRNWLHSFEGSVHFSQAYMSDNWYQGGNNNLNVIANLLWNISLNPNKYTDLLFDNSIQYKIGLSSAPQDSLRGYSISEDLLQINSKVGYKAFKHWYYSMALLFKTQILNNYTVNTNNLTASFLTPGELNIGLGMTYSAKSKNGYATFDMSLSPLSYNMKICRENTRVNPTSMGVNAGHHFGHKVGSSLEAKFKWKITPTISWSSRLYAFTDYDYLQGDWEHTFNFSINKYLSTQFYMHLRYDSSTDRDDSWKYWQFKEILSFGLTYKFSMK